MARRRNSRGASSINSIKQEAKQEPPNEVVTRSGKRRTTPEDSPVKDPAKSPVLRSSSKRSSEFDNLPPKRLSAYAQSLENKSTVSCESGNVLVVVMGKKGKKWFQKDSTPTGNLGSNETPPAKVSQRRSRRRSSGKQVAAAAAGSSSDGDNLPKQKQHDSAKPGSKKKTSTRKSQSSESTGSSGTNVGEKTAASSETPRDVTQTPRDVTQTPRDVTQTPHDVTQTPRDVTPVTSKEECVHHSYNITPAARQAGSATSTTRNAASNTTPFCHVDVAPSDKDRETSASTSPQYIFPLSNANEVVVVLNHPQEIYLRGKAYVRSLFGHVIIHGYVIKPGDIGRPVYSADCSSVLGVSTIQLEASADGGHEAIRASLANEDSITVERILQVVGGDSVVLVFKRLECHICRYVSSFKAFTQLFSGGSDQSSVTPVGTLDLWVVRDIPELYMSYDNDYRFVVQKFCDRAKNGFSPVVVVCGGKNVGKSTLTRFIINSVLNCCSKVAFLDCDVGQTEFTPSGCPALCVITEPLLGPPFTHQNKPRRWSFFGSLSPGSRPSEYLHCLRFAYESYARMNQKPPLVVNTMGWTQGLGIALMVETVRMVQPELIVQINSTRKTKNFPHITSEFVDNDPGFRWSNAPVRNDENKVMHQLVVLNSPVSAKLDGHEKYRPKNLRNLMLLAYFGQLQPLLGPLIDLANLQPYTVPWSAMGVHVCNGAVDDSQVMYALNASVVALCIADTKTMRRRNDSVFPKFFYKGPVCQGVGFGIVRAIDHEKKLFHILTPVPFNKLAKVNCMLRGDLELPEQLSMPMTSGGQCPYIGSPSDVIGASSTKKRRHMFRQKRGSLH